MKKKLKLILLSGVMAVWSGTVQAQTCATQPTCTELGYTLTSTSTCVGTVLKCPFDKTKYYCTQKTEVLNQIKPNWAQKRSLSTSTTTFNVTSDGIVIGSLLDITNVGSELKINGYSMALTGVQKQRSSFFSIVKSGDSVYIKGNDINGYFVPFSGN